MRMSAPAATVSAALASRRSVRAFLDTPVDGALLRDILARCGRAPSGGNLQPWRIFVVGGDDLARFKAIMAERLRTKPSPDPMEYPIYPEKLGEPYRSYRFRIGEALYASLGIAREDKVGRLTQFTNNFRFFGAPVALFCFVDRTMGAPQWSDLGMYLQSVMLLLREHGLDSCPQEAWSTYNRVVRDFVQAPPELMLFCGMAIGYADTNAPINQFPVERMPADEYLRFQGI